LQREFREVKLSNEARLMVIIGQQIRQTSMRIFGIGEEELRVVVDHPDATDLRNFGPKNAFEYVVKRIPQRGKELFILCGINNSETTKEAMFALPLRADVVDSLGA